MASSIFILMSRIADLTDSCVGSKLNVRILRRWAPRFRPNEMWFLAVDQFSDAIQILSIDDGGGFGNSKFQLNRCYMLDAYICTEADKYQRFIKNNIYITVGRASNICQVPDCDALPTFWFSFASIAYLESLMDSDADCPDVIGYFNGCEKLSTKNNDAFVKLDLIHERFCIILYTSINSYYFINMLSTSLFRFFSFFFLLPERTFIPVC
ncbi:hypothetical protein LXL04_003637 [Taraxacum kok-saghyz]